MFSAISTARGGPEIGTYIRVVNTYLTDVLDEMDEDPPYARTSFSLQKRET